MACTIRYAQYFVLLFRITILILITSRDSIIDSKIKHIPRYESFSNREVKEVRPEQSKFTLYFVFRFIEI
ncbi:hypothetical protein EROP_19890 [Erysipelotrichaceae bacterium OPF54]|nr:hypothetical protein EROP_19890 [Erysipelotrichaceae bacterium OPF54]